MTRVFLIAPAGRSRERIEELLDSAGTEIVGRADDLAGFDDELTVGAEIVLIDASTEPLDQLLEALQESGILHEADVVLLVEQAPALWVNQAMHAGVRAVLPAQLRAGQLSVALRAIVEGLLVLHPGERQGRRTSGSVNDELEAVEPLTSREKEVLQLLARGLGNKQIAVRMKISEHTVKFHVASILGKLGASTRTEAVSVGLRRGLVLI